MAVDAPPLFTPAAAAHCATPATRCCIPPRVLFALLSSTCFAISYGTNVVLSIAIVAMVNHTAIAGGNHPNGSNDSWAHVVPLESTFGNAVEPECPPAPGHHPDKDGPFAWDEVVQGYLRGAYYYGYLVGQLPGALWAERHGAKWLLLVANVVNIVGVLVTPAVSFHTGWEVLMAVRILMGVAGAFTFPAMHVMISNWATPEQRGLIAGVIYGGTSLGTIGATLIGGYLAAEVDWPWVFYVIGLASLPWCPLWAFLVTEKPDETPPAQVNINKDLKFPTKQILSSCPFWAILVTHFCNNCGWYLYLTELPGFMEEVLHKNIKENAGLSTVPYALMWALNILLGWGLDALRKTGRLSIGAMRKIATSIASLVPCACLIGISFIGCNADVGTALITVAIMACGGMFVGVLSNHIDLAPNFAGRLMAITNTIATIPGIVMPFVIGELTEREETLSRWSDAFYGTAALYVVMFLVFIIFASGDVQPWNTPHRSLRPDEEERLVRMRDDTLDPYEPLPSMHSVRVAA